MWALRGTAIFIFFLWLFLDGMVVFRRRTNRNENRDRFSIWAIMVGDLVAWLVGIYIAYTPYGVIHHVIPAQIAGLVIMVFGILLRSIAIAQLGRFHTPNVAVLSDHEVVAHGLYRYVRHPSYLGALIAFFGLGLALGNWISLVIIMVLTLAAYLYRIHEEEAALIVSFDQKYREYCRHTKRLIPFIY